MARTSRDPFRIAPVAAIVIVGCLSIGPSAQPASDLPALLAKSAALTEAFLRDFTSVIAEERYEQTTRTLSVGPQSRRVLRSDFLLVRLPNGITPFRDVFEQDGRSVRDRQQRLERLFMAGSMDGVEQARRVVAESTRYNLGTVERTINSPTLPLPLLTTSFQPRLTFRETRRTARQVVVFFEEHASPTYIQSRDKRDVPVKGRFWLDAETGALDRSEIRADTGIVDGRVTITYAMNKAVGLRVPVRMEEQYINRRAQQVITGTATYSNYRRFIVSTTEAPAIR